MVQTVVLVEPMAAPQVLKESIFEVYRTFQAQGKSTVQVVLCCGRLYMGLHAASKCRTCDRPPMNIVVENEEQLKEFLIMNDAILPESILPLSVP